MESKGNLRTPINSNKRRLTSSSISFSGGVHFTSTPFENHESPATKCLKKLKLGKPKFQHGLFSIVEEREENINFVPIIECSNQEKNIKTEKEFDNVENEEILEPPLLGTTVVKLTVSQHPLESSVITYKDETRKKIDDEEIEKLKMDDYSILFDKDDPTLFIMVDEYDSFLEKKDCEAVELAVSVKTGKAFENQMPVKKEAKKIEIFESDNQEENRDNNNPEWKKLERLTTDEERFDVIKKRWQVSHYPCPMKNLSSFNWIQKNHVNPTKWEKNYMFNKNVKANENSSQQTPTILFKKSLEDAEQHFQRTLQLEDRKLNQKLCIMASRQQNEYYNFPYGPFALLHREHVQEVNITLQQHNARLQQLRLAFEEKKNNLNEAIYETERLYNFFYKHQPVLGNEFQLGQSNSQHWLDLEDMIQMYSNYYK